MVSHAKFGNTIDEFVKRYRQDFDLTQKVLAEMMGVNAQYVSNIERRENKFPVSFCALLLPLLDPERQKFLQDLMMEMSIDRLSDRIGVDDELSSRRRQAFRSRLKRESLR